MTRALTLAERGAETTHPNPRVGCVIAKRDRIIAEGWHERAGEAHAEVAALRAATESVEGATAYVTLEPCSHHGRTPPCVDALIEARLARVVFAVQDPDPRVSGSGAEALRNAGIQVDAGLMELDAIELNVGFIKRLRHGTPWVRVKIAMSLDGRTALANGQSKWITGDSAREDVHRWRARSSAILTGVGTVLADDPQLNVRLGHEVSRQPARVILDSALRTPSSAQLFLDDGGEVFIFTSPPEEEGAPAGSPVAAARRESRRVALSETGANIEYLPSETGGLALPAVLGRLAELEFNEVLVEAGATLAGNLVAQSLVDELLVYIAPKLLGPQGRALVNLAELYAIEDAPGFVLVETKQVGDDLRLRLRPR